MNSRDETIKAIKAALQRRSGKPWSVTGGRGTAWGWIRIDAPPSRRTWHSYLPEGMPDRPESYQERDEPTRLYGTMSPAERQELVSLLGLEPGIMRQGVGVPSGGDYYREYIDRAEGRKPAVIGVQYWD